MFHNAVDFPLRTPQTPSQLGIHCNIQELALQHKDNLDLQLLTCGKANIHFVEKQTRSV
jgi:hypothetical protein